MVDAGISPGLANTYARWSAETSGGGRSFAEFEKIINTPGPSKHIEDWRSSLRGELPKLQDNLDKINGSMYEVQINADPEHFLDWDKPLSEQPEKVRGAVKYAFGNVPDNSKFGDFNLPTAPGSAQTRLLKDKGVAGIKYLDAGSRGKGDGSRNYVVFDERLVQIMRKYGLLPAMLGGGAAFGSLSPQDQSQ